MTQTESIMNIEFKYRTYRTAFWELLNVAINETQCKNWFKQLEMAGFTKEEICYVINKEYIRIRGKVYYKSFWTCFIKAIFRVYNDDRQEKYKIIMKKMELDNKPKKSITKKSSGINGYIYFIQGINGGL